MSSSAREVTMIHSSSCDLARGGQEHTVRPAWPACPELPVCFCPVLVPTCLSHTKGKTQDTPSWLLTHSLCTTDMGLRLFEINWHWVYLACLCLWKSCWALNCLLNLKLLCYSWQSLLLPEVVSHFREAFKTRWTSPVPTCVCVCVCL